MKRLALLLGVGILITGVPAAGNDEEVIKVGIIGLDTSHVIAFTRILNDTERKDHVPGAKVIAAFKGGSPDVTASATRIDRFTKQIQEQFGVEIVDSIEELCKRVDCVLLESVDGRPHLDQVKPVFKAGKRVFIDKPMSGSYKDAKEIVRLSKESGVPFFHASSLRYYDSIRRLRDNPKIGKIVGVETWSPCTLEPHHPDLYWYGIHGVEALFAIMGAGCESVQRVHTKDVDVVVGKWSDGRVATFRGLRSGRRGYGAVAYGEKGILSSFQIEGNNTYRNLMVEVVKFFRTGVSPVSPEESLEVMAFMSAADVSKERGGAEVKLKELD